MKSLRMSVIYCAGAICFLLFTGSVHRGLAQNTFPSSGNAGVGTSSPEQLFDIYSAGADPSTMLQIRANRSGYRNVRGRIEVYAGGSIYFDKMFFGTDSSTASARMLTLRGDGNVGIGTTAPVANLHVESPSSTRILVVSTLDNVAYQRITGSTGDWYAGLFGSADYSIGDITNLNAPTYLTIKQGSGKVGIGKTNPDVALDVVGDIKASGVIHAKYQDVAEWVESSEQLAAGTVVVLDSTKSNQVISSTQAYDMRVAGVISEQPGIALGESGAGKVLVAATGRVRVKVDATKSPIGIGDLLVTSDVPGVAMKSEPTVIGNRKMHMPGTLIGKALEPLEKGSGKILVLLSLQ